jgi:hypothetical protein
VQEQILTNVKPAKALELSGSKSMLNNESREERRMSDKMMLGILRMNMPSDNDPAGRLQYEANARLAADEIERLRTTTELVGRCEKLVKEAFVEGTIDAADYFVEDAELELLWNDSEVKKKLADIQKANKNRKEQ